MSPECMNCGSGDSVTFEKTAPLCSECLVEAKERARGVSFANYRPATEIEEVAAPMIVEATCTTPTLPL